MFKNLLFIISLFPLLSFAEHADSYALSSPINTVLATQDSATIGIEVVDQATGKILYSKDASHYFLPASNEKLFTAAAALNLLNKDFAYKTNLFIDTAKIKNHVLQDNMYLQFTGDPTLTVLQLEHLIKALAQVGVEQIQGAIVIDDTAFDQMAMSPGSTWDDKDYCWGSPTNAITVEHNCVTATLIPGVADGQAAHLTLPDYPQSLQFLNNVVTSTTSTENCLLRTDRTNAAFYTISGCIEAAAQPKIIEMAIDNPRDNIQYLLGYLLAKHHIVQNNHFEYKKILSSPPLLASSLSPALPGLLMTMLKESDNTIADSLFKTMGALSAQDSGSFRNGSEAVRNVLNKTMTLGIADTTMIDGSGASRYNYVTPHQIVMLLQQMYVAPAATIFVNALPIGGVDGTLKERMKTSLAVGKVFAKTGTETAVSALSGYIVTSKNHLLVFSIMINGFVDSPKKYKELEDKICAVLYENG